MNRRKFLKAAAGLAAFPAVAAATGPDHKVLPFPVKYERPGACPWRLEIAAALRRLGPSEWLHRDPLTGQDKCIVSDGAVVRLWFHDYRVLTHCPTAVPGRSTAIYDRVYDVLRAIPGDYADPRMFGLAEYRHMTSPVVSNLVTTVAQAWAGEESPGDPRSDCPLPPPDVWRRLSRDPYGGLAAGRLMAWGRHNRALADRPWYPDYLASYNEVAPPGRVVPPTDWTRLSIRAYGLGIMPPA
jgi:hypothetical protein